MVLGPAASFACVLLAAATACAQDAVDPVAHVAALADAAQRAAAHRDLVALGSKAVPALIDGLQITDQGVVAEIAGILQEIGPDAGAAVPALREVLARCDATSRYPAYMALVELVPWRPVETRVDEHWLIAACMHALQDERLRLQPDRLFARANLPVDGDVPALVHVAGSHAAYRVELAVELIGRRGRTAAAALPVLGQLLRRPDPRILTTELFVPVRCKAARAILAIAPDGELADAARDVIDGRLAPEVPAPPPIPDRARSRAAAVVAELAQPEKRDAAAANLVALGRIAVPPLLQALREDEDSAFREAALGVLRDLGPLAVDAVPLLADLLLSLPAEHTPAVVRALTTTLPWSHDVLSLCRQGSAGTLKILGHAIPGPMSLDLQNEIDAALDELFAADAVDPSCTADELQSLLQDPWVLKREAALRVVRARGSSLRVLQPSLASRLDQPQPKRHWSRWQADGSVSTGSDPRDEVVHLLAAEAILAVAASDDPLVAKARAVLASEPGGK
jgi:hypothetical protein